jgi:hypothetical protein
MQRSSSSTGSLRSSQIDWNKRCVYLITSADGAVLFDLDRDEFLKLDPVATEIWALLSEGHTDSQVAEIIAGRYGVETNRVTEDLNRLLQAAAERDITPESVQQRNNSHPDESGNHGPTFPWYGQQSGIVRPRAKLFGVIRAWLALALFDLTLTAFSLKFLCRRVERWPVKAKARNDPDLIGRMCVAVERACVWYPKKAVCLQRSAVTTCLLRSAGVAAEMVVGAGVMPMTAHAWVRVGGSVVNDHHNVERVYQPVVCF